MHAFLLKILLKSIALLPLPLNHLLGRLLGELLWLLPSRNKRVSLINIRLCYPNKDLPWQQKLAKQSLIESSKMLAETAAIWNWSSKRLLKLIKQTSGEEHLLKAQAANKGLIIVAPHIGTWELIGVYLCAQQPLTMMFRPAKTAALTPIMLQARERFGGKTTPTDTSGVRTLLRTLAKGEFISLLPDQEPSQGGGVFSPFFNIPASTMTLLSRLARKKKTPTVFVFMERLPRGQGYHLHWLPIDERLYDADPVVSATAVNAAVEQCIAINPSQYLWSYKRFRQRPEGEASLY
ncbi:MAG: lysophospholipid acyltransferase family protein [Gammaproteobacteria bacterium]|nr:lysophospholipid acyltransferase family protein [Gammaproteobacteria bacterium]